MRKKSVGARRLQAWLQEQRRTQFELCAELHVQPSVLGAWLSGRRKPNLRHAVRLQALTSIAPRLWLVVEDGAVTGEATTA